MTREEFYKKYWELMETYVDICSSLEKYESYYVKFPIIKELRKKKALMEQKIAQANNYY